MATVTTKATNGVSLGFLHTVTAQDVIDGSVTISFSGVDYNIVAVVQVTNPVDADPNTTSPVVDIGDANITYPAVGQVKIANGDSSFTLVANQKIAVIANRASTAV